MLITLYCYGGFILGELAVIGDLYEKVHAIVETRSATETCNAAKNNHLCEKTKNTKIFSLEVDSESIEKKQCYSKVHGRRPEDTFVSCSITYSFRCTAIQLKNTMLFGSTRSCSSRHPTPLLLLSISRFRHTKSPSQ